jgi:MFS family permease
MAASTILIEKKPVSFLLGLSVYNIGINLVWISYNSILLPLMVQNATSEATKGLWMGVISMVSILAGITINIVSGVVSDHSRSKWGRRTPNIVLGMVFSVAVILAAALLPQSLPFVFLGYLLLQIFGNISVGSYQPLLADIVPENQRGTTSGFQGMFTIVGAAIGFVAVTAMVSAGVMSLALFLIAAVFLASTIYNSVVIRPYDQPMESTERLSLGKALGETFRVRRRVPGFFWFVFANFLMYMGVSSFASYGIYYFQTVLQMPDPVKAMGIAGVVGILINVVAAVVAGIVSDRIGRKYLIIGAGLFSGLFSLFFPFLRNFGLFIGISAFYGAANGVVYSVNQALASSLVPAEEAGKYMAYNNLSIGFANALAPLVFGAILNIRGAPTITSFLYFYLVAAAFYFTSSVVIWFKVPKK